MQLAQEDDIATILAIRVTVDGAELGRSLHCRQTRITVGRDADADVRLQDPTVSRIHVVIYQKPEGFVLHDRSSNETLVNGKCVRVHALRDRDLIAIGPYRITVELHRDRQATIHEDALAEGWTIDDARTLAAAELG